MTKEERREEDFLNRWSNMLMSSMLMNDELKFWRGERDIVPDGRWYFNLDDGITELREYKDNRYRIIVTWSPSGYRYGSMVENS